MYHCPTPNCKATEYITVCGPDNMEIGVMVDRWGNPTNRWEDGIVGVQEYIRTWIEGHDCAPNCPLHDQETEWRNE